MKKEYLHKKVVKMPIYSGYLLIILTNSKDKLRAIIPDFADNNIYGHAWWVDYQGKQGFAAVFNFDNSDYPINHGVIAHEAYHIVDFIAEYHDIRSDPSNNEALAYLMGWVVDQIYSAINKFGYAKKIGGS